RGAGWLSWKTDFLREPNPGGKPHRMEQAVFAARGLSGRNRPLTSSATSHLKKAPAGWRLPAVKSRFALFLEGMDAFRVVVAV
ncbi:MAG TPA: hypothetical protein VNM37_17385, partial [Candidatus Dormibacteraeota bacterium]|nr:hypothetical protein [Candidatus Dormibacteraeota bacterium]